MIKGLVIFTDGEVVTKQFTDNLAEEIGNILDGYLELLPLDTKNSVIAYINEDGKLSPGRSGAMLADNPKATGLCALLGTPLHPGDHIVGNMVIFGTGSGCDETDAPDWLPQACELVEVIPSITDNQYYIVLHDGIGSILPKSR
jgi:hypothetical protein